MAQFRLLTKDGKLTRYAMACGYVERTETPTYFLTLEMVGSTIMVSLYNRETKERSQSNCRSAREGYQEYRRVKREVIQEADSRKHDFQPARFTGNLCCAKCGLVPLDEDDAESLCE